VRRSATHPGANDEEESLDDPLSESPLIGLDSSVTDLHLLTVRVSSVTEKNIIAALRCTLQGESLEVEEVEDDKEERRLMLSSVLFGVLESPGRRVWV